MEAIIINFKIFKKTNDDVTEQLKKSHKWLRRILSSVTIFFSVILFLLLLGVLFPSIHYLGEAGTLFETFFSIHLVIASLIFGILSYLVLRLRGKRVAIIGLTISIINAIGFTIPVASLIHTASVYNDKISWSKQLTGGFSMGTPELSKSVKYTTVDGKDLYMDISKPKNFDSKTPLTPVVSIHGGAFMASTRNEEPAWTEFYNDRGYVVFDVDYRLSTSTYHTWDKAAPDIATAIVWIGKHAKEYNADMSKLIVSGASTGGGLALQVAYGIQDGTLKAYEPGKLAKAQAVVAIFPGDDLTAVWNSTLSFLGMNMKSIGSQYLGGSPEQYSNAYATVTPANHITKGTPPTFITAGKNDHIIPYEEHVKFVDTLTKNGIPNKFVSVPYNDHFFVIRPGGLGAQIAFQEVGKFLDKYGK